MSPVTRGELKLAIVSQQYGPPKTTQPRNKQYGEKVKHRVRINHSFSSVYSSRDVYQFLLNCETDDAVCELRVLFFCRANFARATGRRGELQ